MCTTDELLDINRSFYKFTSQHNTNEGIQIGASSTNALSKSDHEFLQPVGTLRLILSPLLCVFTNGVLE